jgi:hypothetical protein
LADELFPLANDGGRQVNVKSHIPPTL